MKKSTALILKHLKQENDKGDFDVFVAGGSRNGNSPIYIEQAFKLGQEIGLRNYQLTFGLSSGGIMGSVAKGVLKAWGQLAKKSESDKKTPIHAFTTKEYLSLYKQDDLIDQFCKIMVTQSLEERKKRLLSADFVIFAPGGVGTLDELAFDCVAMQDGFLNFKPFVFFNINGFFHHALEYLKYIQLEGFSDIMPFIVVDNGFEAGIAFDLLELYYPIQLKITQNPHETLNNLIYILPYMINQKKAHPKKNVNLIVQEMALINENGTRYQKTKLQNAIEAAYLEKETIRMYDRLAKAGKDTALASDKLNELREKVQK